jgi:hypothetical protein
VLLLFVLSQFLPRLLKLGRCFCDISALSLHVLLLFGRHTAHRSESVRERDCALVGTLSVFDISLKSVTLLTHADIVTPHGTLRLQVGRRESSGPCGLTITATGESIQSMASNNKVSAEQKGEMVGRFLPGLAALAAQELAKQIPQTRDGDYQEGNLDLLLELFAFYMHLANRLAFRTLGAQECSRFSSRLIVSVANNVTTSLNSELSSVQTVAELRDKYNQRDEYYSQYRKLVPDGDESPNNTLFWEFTKVIFYGFVNTDDTMDLMQVRGILSQEIAFFLKKTKEVLEA